MEPRRAWLRIFKAADARVRRRTWWRGSQLIDSI
ncbi:hypothetical protein CCACVL1_07813 [Corchorus capsularis]|uniref:Uncharacterized protein n=1 Tax=Corchorus capsularis TaxID=210143 RepID=A0A1R3J3S4_COCAP|nr:hypothetical protein CCACVL1_07813 [Corchorus capsularis]